jgi:mannose-1-phosphate guanylyltransferase
LNLTNETDSPWSIILAGGEGERLRALTERWLGRHKPKQYCTFVGTRSMFQHTVDRCDRISAPEHKIAVVARGHADEVQSQLVPARLGSVITQPKNCDTAVGIFLALTHVRNRDPDATVVLFPSDHFVYPEDRFIEVVKAAAQAAHQMQHWLFLLGVPPDRPEPDYGWIEPSCHLGCINGYRVLAAKGFLEKPTQERCLRAMTRGSLWNTMILAARSETLWKTGWTCFPEVMRLFEAYGEAIGTSDEPSVLETIFEVMPSRNFSTHLLEHAHAQLAVVEMAGVLWCDWGRPDRILETLSYVGKQPAFSWTRTAD